MDDKWEDKLLRTLRQLNKDEELELRFLYRFKEREPEPPKFMLLWIFAGLLYAILFTFLGAMFMDAWYEQSYVCTKQSHLMLKDITY